LTNGLDRTKVTFAQAEGVEPLPSQLQPREVSRQLRALLWRVLHEEIGNYTGHSRDGYGRLDPWLNKPWKSILFDWHTLHEHEFADEFRNDAAKLKDGIKSIVARGDYIRLFEFLQFVIRHRLAYTTLIKSLEGALTAGRAAYRIIDRTIMPIASSEEVATVQNAFHALSDGFEGARAHLRQAGEYLTAGMWSDSIRESIHAVEGVVAVIEPGANTLGPALVKLERSGRLNPNLKRAFNALYDYTSDERGLRHSLVDAPEADVDEATAIYMLGSSASFITYLISKTR
jgi:hypothetical protein